MSRRVYVDNGNVASLVRPVSVWHALYPKYKTGSAYDREAHGRRRVPAPSSSQSSLSSPE